MSHSDLGDLEARLGYRFRNPALLTQALTHKSYLNETTEDASGDNERLEFLGDAVLDLVVSEALVEREPEWSEGDLSRSKASLVREESLASAASDAEIGRFLRLGRGERLTRGDQKPSLLADALEAVIAAIYLDGGLEAAGQVVRRLLVNPKTADAIGAENEDSKTSLQEVCQRKFGELPVYRLLSESGPDHDKRFTVEVVVQGMARGTGEGRTKKQAEQRAALKALGG